MSELTDETFEKMLEIAKENLLNPLYEQVVEEYGAAKVRLETARNKLAQAVKLTDNEELLERTKQVDLSEDDRYFQALFNEFHYR
jgi:hypothetical protein